MKTATLLKRSIPQSGADQRLYRLSEPLEDDWGWARDDDEETPAYEYVVVSAVYATWTGPETYIFGADETGKTVNWSELPGSFRGALDHERALREAGYEVVGEATPDGR